MWNCAFSPSEKSHLLGSKIPLSWDSPPIPHPDLKLPVLKAAKEKDVMGVKGVIEQGT